MPSPRHFLAGSIKTAVARAIEDNDQKYGRQLATMFERSALVLRATLGGEPLWRTHSTAENRVDPHGNWICSSDICVDNPSIKALPLYRQGGPCPACGEALEKNSEA